LKRLAIVPARGGSKRIPRKNIKEFHGKPIILWTLDQILLSEKFSKIHVSTDDVEIRDVVSSAGFAPDFMRSFEASTDLAPLSEVTKFVVDEYSRKGEHFDLIAIFFPTGVFLSAKTITAALIEFEGSDKINEMISVCPYGVPIEWAMRMEADGVLTAVDEAGITMRSQDLIPAWHETGEFVFYKNSRADLDNGRRHVIKGGYPVKHIPVDIDEPKDWLLAESIFDYQNRIAGE
jgi:N-acylneuraminate cytidylyltransferase